MKQLLVYYGWLNSFNSATNSWDNDNVITDIAGKYDVVVFGDGVADPAHGDYANSQYIIDGLKAAKPTIEIFGYVSINQPLSDFQAKASQWDTMNVHGIFFDEAGYDFGKTREDLNKCIKFVREMNGDDKIFVNSWNINHVIGIEDDPSFPNATFNPGLVESDLLPTDYYMLESFTVVNGSYEPAPQWYLRANAAKLKEQSHGVKSLAVSIIDDADVDGQEKFNNIYYGAHIWNLEGVGSSHLSYGAPDAKVKFWTRPDVSHI